MGRDSSAMKHPIMGPWKEIMAREKEMTRRTQHKRNNTLAGYFSATGYIPKPTSVESSYSF